MSIQALKGKRVFVTGHGGMVGSACVRRLSLEDSEIIVASRAELDLVRQDAVERFMMDVRPDVVIVAAGRVGGIVANDVYPVDFLYDNLMIQSNLITAAYRNGVERLLFLGSSCIYPREAKQPISEDALLTGPLETTNQWYAIAKIAGIKLCQAYRKQYGVDYISAMPCNLYGPNDYFNPERSHVIPGMMQRFHQARQEKRPEVICWGSGRPRREFLHVDDLANACVFLLKHYSEDEHVNIGTGADISVAELAEHIRHVTDYKGKITWDRSRPDGTLLKRMDTSRINGLGWKPSIPFASGLVDAYRWFLEQHSLRQ